MKKNIIVYLLLIILSFFLFSAKTVFAEDQNSDYESGIEESIENLLGSLNLEELEKLISEYLNDNSTVKEVILKCITGEYLDANAFFSAILEALKNNLLPLSKTFISIIAIVLICGILSSLKSEKGQLKDLIFIVCYCGVGIVIFAQCASLIKSVSGIVDNVKKHTDGLFPILITLLSVTGANSTVTVYQPVCLFISNNVMFLIKEVLFPLISINAVVCLISSISEKHSLKKFSNFLNDLFKWIIGFAISIFSIFTGVKGISAITYDNFSIRALKYAVGNSFPLIGGFAREGVDVVLASGILIKNAVGTLAIIIILFIMLSPFLEIAILSLSFKLLSAITEPIADSRITNLISSFSKVVTMLSSLLLMVFVIYFITLILLISAQNGVAL